MPAFIRGPILTLTFFLQQIARGFLSNFESEHNLGRNRLFLIQSCIFVDLQMTGHTVQNLVNNSFLSHIEARQVIMAS